jgi:hypothetical protein
VVDHLTTIVPEREVPPGRAAALGEALTLLGFAREERRGSAVYRSNRIEAGAAKAYLRGQGFHDREFRILLEYQRLWGIM